MNIEEVHLNNFVVVKRLGLHVGMFLKSKSTPACWKITHIHPLYGWLSVDSVSDIHYCGCPRQDFSNINDFEVKS